MSTKSSVDVSTSYGSCEVSGVPCRWMPGEYLCPLTSQVGWIIVMPHCMEWLQAIYTGCRSWWMLLLDWLPTLAGASILHQLFTTFYTGCQSNSGSSSRLLCSLSSASVLVMQIMVMVLVTSMASAQRWQTFLDVPVCELLIVVTFSCRQLRRRLVVEVSELQRLLYGTHLPFICAIELSANDYFDQGWKHTYFN